MDALSAVKRLQEVLKQLWPAVPTGARPEVERAFQALRNHVYFFESQKRELDELRRALDEV